MLCFASNYFERKDIFTYRQFGYIKYKSTSHAVIDQMQFLHDTLDNNNNVTFTFLDFQKAFDRVHKDILLSKLWHYGKNGRSYSVLKS